ncbi:hypothetical protein MTP10_19845 [Nonomuraea sp. 3-1Str]|uniref:hypothetical protein n=1 Tax=Nonomuraea sp. 3-1Str TaxID=2929801 RepID=UPI002858D653|nr:hypothetical protein [Nonomuraea sp. 3-1Str]MDR8410976.1 hypothetical protein [Nonomuraea sp. 3-1Str]
MSGSRLSGSRWSGGRSRRGREAGTLPRPLALLAALGLAAATGVSLTLLPARAMPDLVPAATSPALARPRPPDVPEAATAGPASFVRFAEPGRDPGFDLAADARLTGARWYALGHLVAGPDTCTSAWTTSSSATPLTDTDGALVAGIRALREEGGGAGVVLGGSRGRELAATCATPESLAAAYGDVVARLGAAYLDIEPTAVEARDSDPGDGEPGDGADRAVVIRRARALALLQRERRLPVTFTLPLRSDGLAERDVAMLRLTRAHGAEVATVNLLSPIEPSGAPPGRLRRVASAVRAAVRQVAEIQGLDGPADAWHRVALTPVLGAAADLNETDARALAAFVARNDLAWLSLRGAEPEPAVARVLWHTLA